MTIQTTTFKGARYIVKFHDPIQWSNQESYEAIEAVQYNAYTYISKQPVPAGVQISNTDFWLLWADPNAQMEQLRQLVSQYIDQVKTLSGTVDNLNASLEGEIENRQNADSAIELDIDSVKNVLPFESFTGQNTVKNYIDSKTAIINELTKDSTPAQIIANGYIDYLHAYATIIKMPKTSYRIQGLLDYSYNTVSTFANNPRKIFGAPSAVSSYLSDGTVHGSSTHQTGWGWVAIDESGSITWVDDFDCILTPNDLKNQGYVHAWIGFGKIVSNGQLVDLDTIPQTAPERNYIINSNNARSLIGWDDEYIYVGIVDGRSPFSKGCTLPEMQTYVKTLGIDNCINTDGGGSVQLWIGGFGYNAAHIRNPSTPEYFKPGEARLKTLAIFERSE